MKLNDVTKELIFMAAHVKSANSLPDNSAESLVDELKKIALMLKKVELIEK